VSVNVRFVVDKVALVQVFLRVLPPVSIIALVLHFLLHFITSLTKKDKGPKAENVQTDKIFFQISERKSTLKFYVYF